MFQQIRSFRSDEYFINPFSQHNHTNRGRIYRAQHEHTNRGRIYRVQHDHTNRGGIYRVQHDHTNRGRTIEGSII